MVAVAVELHQACILAEHGGAIGHLGARVQRLCQGRDRGLVAHFLDADGHGRVDGATGDGEVGHAQRGGARCGCGAHGDGFNASQTGFVGDERGQMLL